MKADKRLIVALDFNSLDKVKSLVDKLGQTVSYYKVGMELFYSVGHEAIRYLRDKGKEVFLDLKLHDIPNTVGQSTAALAASGVSMLNVHASGGLSMMRAARESVEHCADQLGVKPPKLIAVTVLTSLNETEWQALGYSDSSITGQVIHLAKLAQAARLDGVVASPHEATAIRAACGEDFLIVTPGVRPAGVAVDDQSRIATPALALKSGASHLVVGRPITAAQDPYAAAEAIIKEMRNAR